ncbi:MAG: hypothetical protein JWR63_996 [Conexibacter sp.]|nr:hypothetical protein [Conexibacter sp.]
MNENVDHDAVDVLVRVLRAGGQPPPSVLEPVLRELRVWLARRRLTSHDLEDVTLEALTRLLVAVKDGGLDPGRPAGAWLRVVADNLAKDVQRSARRHPAVEYDEQTVGRDDHDKLSAVIEHAVAHSGLRDALRAAADAGDHRAVAVVTAWLALAEGNGEVPSSRDVAKRLGISHMTVQRTIDRFAKFLPR